jgi:hypothetical protein
VLVVSFNLSLQLQQNVREREAKELEREFAISGSSDGIAERKKIILKFSHALGLDED